MLCNLVMVAVLINVYWLSSTLATDKFHFLEDLASHLKLHHLEYFISQPDLWYYPSETRDLKIEEQSLDYVSNVVILCSLCKKFQDILEIKSSIVRSKMIQNALKKKERKISIMLACF